MEKPGITPPEEKFSPLESSLLERFKKEKAIDLDNLNVKEKGALGKLAAKKLVEKAKEPVDGKMKTIWKLKESEPTSMPPTEVKPTE